MIRLFLLIILAPFLIYTAPCEKDYAQRIQSYLILRCPNLAVEEAEQSLRLFPDSRAIYRASVSAWSAVGDWRNLKGAYQRYQTQCPDAAQDDVLLEEIAWGIIQKASLSPSLMLREMACIGAYLGEGSVGVGMLKKAMHDSNDLVRAQAVRIASSLRDTMLIDEIKILFQREKKWIVRQEVIRAIGEMEIDSLKESLEHLLSDPSLSLEEIVLIAESLEKVIGQVDRNELMKLTHHSRAGFRLIGCALICKQQDSSQIDLLTVLADDSNDRVRLAAIQGLCLLCSQGSKEAMCLVAQKKIKDPQPYVSIAASILAVLCDLELGSRSLKYWIYQGEVEEQEFAAASLASAGESARVLMRDLFLNHTDPSVRLNLAFGLIRQRALDKQVIAFIKARLRAHQELWKKRSLGRQLVFSCRASLKGEATENQLLRLEMCNLLALLGEDELREAIQSALLTRDWSLSFAASALLLVEGNQSALELVRERLMDPRPQVRLNTALLLAIWGREEKTIDFLQTHYKNVSHHQKILILEGIGRVGSRKSIPFLIEVLWEASESLRLIGAVALLQCLNH